MCRICGRMVKCIFDTMPSRTISRPSRTALASAWKRNLQSQTLRQISSQARLPQGPPLQARMIGLPFRCKFHTSMRQQADVDSSIHIPSRSTAPPPPSVLEPSTQELSSAATITTTITAPEAQDSADSKPLVLSKSLQQLLPALKAQTPHYITAHIHSFPYLLTEGDTLRLPFQMKGVNPGDILRFNRATILGSRDYTLKAGSSSPQHSSPPHVRGEAYTNKRRSGEPSYIDERLFECRMRVMGLDSGPMMIKEKKKRRNRRTRKAASKHKYTVLKVMEVRVKNLDEIMSTEGQQVVLE